MAGEPFGDRTWASPTHSGILRQRGTVGRSDCGPHNVQCALLVLGGQWKR